MTLSPYPLVIGQQGIALVEVMVALFLLAIGILGFSAMQTMAHKATDESILRTRALSVIRGGAEMMRANPAGIEAFKMAVNATAVSTVSSLEGISSTSCQGVNAGCTIEQMAIRDAIALTTYAKYNQLQLAMVTCPLITPAIDIDDSHTTNIKISAEQQCFVMAWGRTKAILDDTEPTACANTEGTYRAGSQCFIIESY